MLYLQLRNNIEIAIYRDNSHSESERERYREIENSQSESEREGERQRERERERERERKGEIKSLELVAVCRLLAMISTSSRERQH